MVLTRHIFFLCAFFLLTAVLGAQDISSSLNTARTQFAEGDFVAASKTILEAAADFPGNNTAVAEAFSEIGVTEYNRRNYKNAYQAFREALKIQSTNQTATQYYLRMRREMDINNLRNEYTASTQSTQVTATGTPGTPAAESGSASTAPTTASQEAANQEDDLKILIAQLRAAESRIANTENASSSVRSDNDLLRNQLESQRQLVEKMLVTQRATPAETADSAQLQETIKLLSVIAERDASRPIVVQSDPALQALVQELSAERKDINNPFSSRNVITTMALIVMSLILLAIAIIIILAIRARRSNKNSMPDPYAASFAKLTANTENQSAIGYLPDSRSAGLLEYTGQSRDVANHDDINLRTALLKADHLNKMYNDVKTGNLNWDTIRAYIDDLDKALRVEILQVVEAKLESGALITPESALPILFPFITDFDEYISDKAQAIAHKALTSSKESKGCEDADSLFAVQALLRIPSQLEKVLSGKDRSLVTAKLAMGVAKALGLSKNDCDLIYKGALAHDAGYLILDADKLKQVIAKPEINDEDWVFIQSHVQNGPLYFGDAEVPLTILECILHHHERNDGSGYPQGLKGEDIPLSAKIVGVCETFTSLISNRSYREKMESSHALAIVKDGSRRKFDQDIIAALEKVIRSNGGQV